MTSMKIFFTERGRILLIFILILLLNRGLPAQDNQFIQKDNIQSLTDDDKNGHCDSGIKTKISPGLYPESVKDTGDIIQIIVLPEGNNQGLTWDGDYIWCSLTGWELIYKLDPDNGTVIDSFPSPGNYPEGLAWDGAHLYVCDNGGGNLNPDFLYKMDPDNGSVVSTLPLDNVGWPHGITWDGQNIWMNSFSSDSIFKINQETGQVLHAIPAPGAASIGLTWDGQYLWTDDFEQDMIYRISPVDGSIQYAFPSPHTNPRDLAWNGQSLFILTPDTIFLVDVGNISQINENDLQNATTLTVYPNPFRDNTTISYVLYQPSNVWIGISDVHGKLVEVLIDEPKSKGDYEISWQRDTGRLQHLQNGLYFCSIRTGDISETIKIILNR